MNTLGRSITVFASVAVMAFGGAGVAQAKHGSDDPVKEVRGDKGRGADDLQPHARRGADDRQLESCLKRARRSHSRSERKHKAAHCKRAAKRRADDRAGDDRGGQLAPGVSDDPAGDDNGGQRPAGVSDDPAGDDNGGGRHGADDPAGHR
jgi:hypothetical protein